MSTKSVLKVQFCKTDGHAPIYGGNQQGFGHIARKDLYLEKDKPIIEETTPGSRRKGRLKTAWMDNVRTEKNIGSTANSESWRATVYDVQLSLGSRMAEGTRDWLRRTSPKLLILFYGVWDVKLY